MNEYIIRYIYEFIRGIYNLISRWRKCSLILGFWNLNFYCFEKVFFVCRWYFIGKKIFGRKRISLVIFINSIFSGWKNSFLLVCLLLLTILKILFYSKDIFYVDIIFNIVL